MNKQIKDIIHGDDLEKKRALFSFDSNDSNDRVRIKFNLWAKYYQAKYFKVDDADFHRDIDLYNIQAYRGQINSFVDIVFRGGAKTARTKLFLAFAISNDLDNSRKYIKILSKDGINAKQIVTDIYNIFVTIKKDYPEIFQKTLTKREERMNAFTTSTGIKVIADTVGTEQRGALQDDSRPDLIWFEDFENRKTLHSLIITQSIWDNMEEARTGLARGGSCIYTCNYISEAGNVHKIVQKKSEKNIVMIIPIIDKDCKLTWDKYYTIEDIELMKQTDDDFEGERLCEPSAGADIVFKRDVLNEMRTFEVEEDVMGFKEFYPYDENHFYASGHDVAAGIGLDSSASVFIDFTSTPARVVATYSSNTIKPEYFGEEIKRQQDIYGGCVSAPENNLYSECILRLRQLDGNLYVTERKDSAIKQNVATEFGWHTGNNKQNAMTALITAVNKGNLIIPDENLLNECRSYTRNDLLDRTVDPRLTTRHFDLLMACMIAWQMKDYQPVFFAKKPKEDPIKKPLNMGWVEEKNQMDNLIEETYL